MSQVCTVVGAGIAGCSVARMLAERGIAVRLYEQSQHIGGILRSLPEATIATTDKQACAWLIAIAPLAALDEGTMRPKRGYEWLCERLVEHKNVSLMKHCGVTDIIIARATTPFVVSCVSPDAVTHNRFGVLPWQNAKPFYTQTSMQQYQAYARLLGLSSIYSCGSLATFAVLSIPQIIRQAMAVTDAITCPGQPRLPAVSVVPSPRTQATR